MILERRNHRIGRSIPVTALLTGTVHSMGRFERGETLKNFAPGPRAVCWYRGALFWLLLSVMIAREWKGECMRLIYYAKGKAAAADERKCCC